jgi:hypothetical protein
MASTENAFPDGSDSPAGRSQCHADFEVIRTVLSDFRRPEFGTRPGQAEQRAVMPMPETAVNKHDRTKSWEDYIRLSRQIWVVDAKPESTPVKETADKLLRFCITTANAGHHAAARGAVYNICHWLLRKQYPGIIRCPAKSRRARQRPFARSLHRRRRPGIQAASLFSSVRRSRTRRLPPMTLSFMSRATAAKTGTTTELPN